MGLRTLFELIRHSPKVPVPHPRIAESDPAWDAIRHQLAHLGTAPLPDDHGHVYVTEFAGAHRYIKIGSGSLSVKRAP